MKIRMVSESTFLGKTFAADVARVRSLPRVDAHVSDECIVNSELTLTNLTAIGFLVGVGTVVQRQLCGRMVKRVLFKEREKARNSGDKHICKHHSYSGEGIPVQQIRL